MQSISVIIPVKNGAQYICEALNSVLAQTVKATEIIVVDDGSTDNLISVLEPYRKREEIRYFRTEGLGTAAARNIGIEHAIGEFVAFLDADDSWLPHKLERQLPTLTDERVVLSYTDMHVFGKQHGLYKNLQRCTYRRGATTKQLLESNFIPTSTVIARRDAVQGLGGFLVDKAQVPIGEDYYLWLRLSQKGLIEYVDEPLTEYRTHDMQSSRRQSASYRSLSVMFKRLLTDPAFDMYTDSIKKRIRECTIKCLIYRILWH